MPQLQTHDLSIHYEESGAGTPLLLIHGHPFDAEMWSPQLAASFSGFRLLAPDLRNFGRTASPTPAADFTTYAQDVLDFADALGMEKFVVAGLSMGGQIALELAALAPQRLLGLILADTFAQLDTPEKKAWRYTLADRIDAEGLDDYAVEVLLRMFCPATIARDADLAASLVRMMQRSPAAGAATALRTRAERRDYLPLLPSITVPTLIVVGSEDEFTPLPDAQLMHRNIRSSKMVVIDEAGHLPNLEQPGKFNATLNAYLQTLDRRPKS